jgi:hypothetical protein
VTQFVIDFLKVKWISRGLQAAKRIPYITALYSLGIISYGEPTLPMFFRHKEVRVSKNASAHYGG